MPKAAAGSGPKMDFKEMKSEPKVPAVDFKEMKVCISAPLSPLSPALYSILSGKYYGGVGPKHVWTGRRPAGG